ncbi:MAG: ATP-grasp domain-containing protein [Pseudomonadota bacterium]
MTQAAIETRPAQDTDTLAGKRIVIVGGGSNEFAARGNPFVDRARELDVSVLLLAEERSIDSVDAQLLIPVENVDYQSCYDALAAYLAQHPIDGITTFLEEYIELTARLQNAFGFKGHSAWGSHACRNKWIMRNLQRDHSLPHPKFMLLDSRQDATDIARCFPMPAFLKPVDGAGSIGTRRVDTADELPVAFDGVCRAIVQSIPAGFRTSVLQAFTVGQANLLLEEYLAPTERLARLGLGRVGIELLVQDGQVKFFAMADGECVSATDHRYVSLSFPSRLNAQDQQAFRELANKVVVAFGLSDGPIVLDAVMTDSGPQLYEINARMEGAMILPALQRCYGVDMVEQALRIATGLPVETEHAETSKSASSVFFALAGSRSEVLSIDLPEPDSNTCECRVSRHKSPGDTVAGPEAPYDALAIVTITGPDREAVDQCLLNYRSNMAIELKELD